MMSDRSFNGKMPPASPQQPGPGQNLVNSEREVCETLKSLRDFLLREVQPGFQVPFEVLGTQIGLEHGRLVIDQNLRQRPVSADILSRFASAAESLSAQRPVPRLAGTPLAYPAFTSRFPQLDDKYNYRFNDEKEAIAYLTRQAQTLRSGSKQKDSGLDFKFEVPDRIDAFNARALASEVATGMWLSLGRRSFMYGQTPGAERHAQRIKEDMFAAAAVIEAFHYFERHGKDIPFSTSATASPYRFRTETAEKFVNLIWTSASRRPPASDGTLLDITSSLGEAGMRLLSESLVKHIQNDPLGHNFHLLLRDQSGDIHALYGERLANLAGRAFEKLTEDRSERV